MYNSGISAIDLIEDIESEADVSIDIPRSVFIRAINYVEQFIYTEVLKEYVAVKLGYPGETISLADLPVPDGAARVEYDDVMRVFGDGMEAERAGASAIVEFPEKDLYTTDYNGNLILAFAGNVSEVVIIVRVRPALKNEGDDDPVRVPAEHIELVASKMRGEAYRIANEDGLAAKWLAEYNACLENFKVWAASRTRRYGG